MNSKGQVNYRALKAGRTDLDAFIGLIARVGPKSRPEFFPTRSHRLAYYINAYNALTIFNVINRMPGLKRVIDEKINFFYFTEFLLDGEAISLYRLENDIIRPQFNEPRIHFALNCASLGCPQLPTQPFLAGKLHDQLSAETSKFLQDRRNLSIENQQIIISEIFKWYSEDFRPNPIAWIKKTIPSLQLSAGMPVTYGAYDWQLNSQPAH